MFGPSIEKAKRIAIRDLRECVASTGILQTRQFVPVEAYIELVDSVFRLVWFALYREYLEQEGLNGTLSPGKLLAMCQKTRIPTRIYELAIHTLSPVLMKTEVFIPAQELVTCRTFSNLENVTPVFSVTLGPLDPLCSRYGISMRVGMIRVMNNLPGLMTMVSPIHISSVFCVLRVIKFARPEGDWTALERDVIDNNIMEEPFADVRPVNVGEQMMTAPNFVARADELELELFPDGVADYGNVHESKWFCPYIYTRAENHHHSYTMACYLPLIIYTMDDVELNGIRADTLRNDIDLDDSFTPSFANSLNRDFGAGIMQALKSLRIKEGRLTPIFETHDEVYGILRAMIVKGWKDISFPELDSMYAWLQPDWMLPSDSPFFPYTIKWTRQVRNELRAKRNVKEDETLQVNPHESETSKV